MSERTEDSTENSDRIRQPKISSITWVYLGSILATVLLMSIIQMWAPDDSIDPSFIGEHPMITAAVIMAFYFGAVIALSIVLVMSFTFIGPFMLAKDISGLFSGRPPNVPHSGRSVKWAVGPGSASGDQTRQ